MASGWVAGKRLGCDGWDLLDPEGHVDKGSIINKLVVQGPACFAKDAESRIFLVQDSELVRASSMLALGSLMNVNRKPPSTGADTPFTEGMPGLIKKNSTLPFMCEDTVRKAIGSNPAENSFPSFRSPTSGWFPAQWEGWLMSCKMVSGKGKLLNTSMMIEWQRIEEI